MRKQHTTLLSTQYGGISALVGLGLLSGNARLQALIGLLDLSLQSVLRISDGVSKLSISPWSVDLVDLLGVDCIVLHQSK